LHDILTDYAVDKPGLFTTYTKIPQRLRREEGAVSVIISANDLDYMLSQDSATLLTTVGTTLVWVSHQASSHSSAATGTLSLLAISWDGTGTIPDDTKAALQDIVAQVHGEDKILRFWNLPQDAPSVWGRSTMPTST